MIEFFLHHVHAYQLQCLINDTVCNSCACCNLAISLGAVLLQSIVLSCLICFRMACQVHKLRKGNLS